MRLWSINPEYLDSIGLIAVWRESLLAKKVLEGKTIGYKKHPQLERFKNNNKKEKNRIDKKYYSKKESIKLINNYLHYIFLESKKRNYNFDKTKYKEYNQKELIVIPKGQLEFEFEHLQKKLFKRNKKKFLENKKLLKEKKKIDSNKLFKIVNGTVCDWEKF
jgi:hypothetical protein